MGLRGRGHLFRDKAPPLPLPVQHGRYKACVALASGGNTIRHTYRISELGRKRLEPDERHPDYGAGTWQHGNYIWLCCDYVPSSSNWAANYDSRLSGFTFGQRGLTCWDSPCFLFSMQGAPCLPKRTYGSIITGSATAGGPTAVSCMAFVVSSITIRST